MARRQLVSLKLCLAWKLRIAYCFRQGETAVNLPESYPLFGMHQPQTKLSAPYWSDGLDRDHDLTLPVESVVGILSQPANDDTKPFVVDEGALKAYALYILGTMKSV